MAEQGEDAGLRACSFPDPWFVIDDARRSVFVAELRHEVAEGHPLHGMKAVAVAQCGGCDRIVFSLDGPSTTTWPLVHLTGSKRPEPMPWPTTVTFDDVPALREALERHEH